MVLCASAGLSASLRSAANLLAAAHKTSFLLLIHNILLLTKQVLKGKLLWSIVTYLNV
jgi:hypothetical protein